MHGVSTRKRDEYISLVPSTICLGDVEPHM